MMQWQVPQCCQRVCLPYQNLTVTLFPLQRFLRRFAVGKSSGEKNIHSLYQKMCTKFWVCTHTSSRWALKKSNHVTRISIVVHHKNTLSSCFYIISYVSLQNSGAVATWTKSWWWCRICNKNHSVSFTFPILFFIENTKVGTIAMSFAHKSRWPK